MSLDQTDQDSRSASQQPVQTANDKAVLRARDFWGALVLIAVSLFFLWRTSFIPLWGENRAGVSGGDWYNSAALVPLGIFTAMGLMAVSVLVTSIREGGASRALSSVGIGWNGFEAWRIVTITVSLVFYIGALVPRVDFIASSGLLITALIYGYHTGNPRRMGIAAASVMLAGLYALIAHFPQAEWNAPHDDDMVTLVIWAVFTVVVLVQARGSSVMKAIPVIALLVPTILVCAMAFGFRQNVPNRGGLLFSQIEYNYYVNLRPLWRDR